MDPKDDSACAFADNGFELEMQVIGPHPTMDQNGTWRLVFLDSGEYGQWETPITREIGEALCRLIRFQVTPLNA